MVVGAGAADAVFEGLEGAAAGESGGARFRRWRIGWPEACAVGEMTRMARKKRKMTVEMRPIVDGELRIVERVLGSARW